MASPPLSNPASRKLRLWPGVVLVLAQWVCWSVLPRLVPGTAALGLLAGLALGPVVLLWWLFFSRAPWLERLTTIAAMVGGVMLTESFVHPSIAGGMMGRMLSVYAIPAMSLALVSGLVIGRHGTAVRRRAWTAVAILVGLAAFTLIRTGGVTGDGASDLHWRWTPTPEQRLMAAAPAGLTPTSAPVPIPVSKPATEPPASVVAAPAATIPLGEPAPAEPEWAGFRGADRDSVARGVRIATDWAEVRPETLWRRPVGPGWSSFAVSGGLAYTQEQLGEEELVTAYSLSTGAPVWRHADPARFYESNAGPGPRATPTLARGRVFTLGATGILNALDARTGAVFWSRNAAEDTTAKLPGWGYAGSPLVLGDTVIVSTSGMLAAYDATTGSPRWKGPPARGGYSSPHLVTLEGEPQVVLLTGDGAVSLSPADGSLNWQAEWEGTPMLQPALTADGDLLLTTGDMMGGLGVRRLRVSRSNGQWMTVERWTSRGLKPYFNDFVVHKGHAFGFDGSILSCIDLTDGARKWKGGRYGSGQLLLLPEQDVLLVLAEEGDLALVSATPDGFRQLSRSPAIEGKTWNHPVLVGDVLLVRNGEEMAAFRLPRAGR